MDNNRVIRNQNAPSSRQWWLWAPLLLGLAGCKPTEIQVYQIPKEDPSRPAPPADAVHAHRAMGMGGQQSVTFQLPEGWKEKPAERMRVAQIIVPGPNGVDAEISIIPLVGMTASREDIMNIWREQLRLPPLDKAAAETAVTVVEVGDGQGDLYDLVSQEPLMNNQHKMRILAAVRETGGTSWFIKMTGPDELVREAKTNFLTFLKSLTWSSGDTAMQSTALAGPVGTGASVPRWEPPAHWREQKPPGPMLTAKYIISSEDGKQAEVTVSSLAGDGGGALPNVNRWRGQLLLPAVTAQELPKISTPVDINGQSVALYDMEGTSAKSGDPARMLVLGLPAGGQTWFYKLLGDSALVAREKEAFLNFVRSAKHSDAQ